MVAQESIRIRDLLVSRYGADDVWVDAIPEAVASGFNTGSTAIVIHDFPAEGINTKDGLAGLFVDLSVKVFGAPRNAAINTLNRDILNYLAPLLPALNLNIEQVSAAAQDEISGYYFTEILIRGFVPFVPQ